jgi:hypothetical protein
MKKRMISFMAFLLVFTMILPVLPLGKVQVASGATKPSLSVSSKTIIGVDGTFTVNLRNAGSNVKSLFWYTKNEDVAVVEATGDQTSAKVTAVGKGTTYIRCRVTYKNGTKAFPQVKVTVKIPATKVEISNAQDDALNNNRHVIAVGDKFDFNRRVLPSNSDMKVYWVIDNGKDGTQYATVNSAGLVTGLKPGIVQLRAVAAFSKADIETSIIDDAINIEIVPKTVGVKSVKLEDTTTLKITFDSAIKIDSVIGANNKLLDSVTITAKTDTNNVTANPLGTLSATLSVDGKVLTITSQNNFNGLYGLQLSDSIKGIDGTSLQEYYENLQLYDKTAPAYKDFTLDPTGLKVTINFTEAMDFTAMDITSVSMLEAGKTPQAATTSLLSIETNYVKSADRKSLTIDLTSMPLVDQNKMFAVNISGIKDLAGNYPVQYPMTVYLSTDTTPKPQATLISITRTAYDKLTASFNRPIKTAGTLLINSSDMPMGNIDPEDPTKVHYTLTANSLLLTGLQSVQIGFWNGYNVSPTDNSANAMRTVSVDFTVDRTPPYIIQTALTNEIINGVATNVLTLTYNKKVTLLSDTGTFVSSLVTTNNDRYSNKLISYTATTQDTKVILYLNNEQVAQSGIYTISIPTAFVKDLYMNYNVAASVSMVKEATAANVLPAPKSVTQLTGTPSIIEVFFEQKVDEASAQNLANYYIAGVSLASAVLVDNNDAGARIRLNVQPGTITASTVYPITIKGVKGYNNSYSEMSEYKAPMYLYENVAPTLTGVTFTYPSTITYTFSETLTGTPSFQVIQGTTDLASGATISGNTIIITLKQAPSLSSTMLVVPTQTNSVKDSSGNIATIITRSISPTVN